MLYALLAALALAAYLAWQLRLERESGRAERAQLLNRIQAPHLLPPETMPEGDGAGKWVPPFDDSAWDDHLNLGTD